MFQGDKVNTMHPGAGLVSLGYHDVRMREEEESEGDTPALENVTPIPVFPPQTTVELLVWSL